MTVHFHVRFTRENAKKHDLCECEFASPSDVVFAIIRIKTTMATFVIAYILIGIAQIWAAIEGMQFYFGIGGLLAVILLFVAYAVPFVGAIGVAFLTYYGARYDWKWEWWQALMLVAPSIVLMLIAGAAVGLAIWAQRLGRLISLHHHLAAGDRDGQQ
jgi:hypothetical protein